MRMLVRVLSPCAALIMALPLAAGAQEAGESSNPPSAIRTRQAEGKPNRVAVPRRPSEPVRAAEPAPAAGEKSPVPAANPRANTDTRADAEQQRQRGRTAQPRGGDRRGRDGGDRSWGGRRRGPVDSRPVYVRPYYPSRSWGGRGWYARRSFYDPYWSRGVIAWNPLFYAPWGLMWGTAGHWGHYGWGYPGWGYPGMHGTTTFDTGGVRLQMRPRDAEVLVDGYYAGHVDDFDGVFQSIRLAPGGHKIEVRMPGFETRVFDVHVQPDRTLTIKEDLSAVP